MKKILALMMSLVMVMCLFAACGNKEEDPSTTEGESASDEAASEDEATTEA